MSDKLFILLAVWAIGAVLAIVVIAPLAVVTRLRWPTLEEWAAILWPVTAVVLIVVLLIALAIEVPSRAWLWAKGRPQSEMDQ